MSTTFLPEIAALCGHAARLGDTSIADLIAARPTPLALPCGPLWIDFSRQRIDASTIAALAALARKRNFDTARRTLLDGGIANVTEARPACHVALRNDLRAPRFGTSTMQAEVAATLKRMESITQALRSSTWRGASGEAITHVVHIGIGGSDLGPRMVCRALQGNTAGPSSGERDLEIRFVANVDPADLARQLTGLKPATTVFILASKTFKTAETLANGQAARAWLEADMAAASLTPHFIAISNNVADAVQFGVPAEHVLPMPEWVGGRYSLWSAIGLPIALGFGWESFTQLLAGARAVDTHFADTPLIENAAWLMGALATWNTTFLNRLSHVTLAYADALELFVNHLQQLDMESLGKSVQRDGAPVNVASGAIEWGGVGSNTQHSFHQLLHQGTAAFTADFIVPLKPAVNANAAAHAQHRILVANAFAQSAALMHGAQPDATSTPLAAHRAMPGNRASTMILCERINAESIGALVALYEHKVFTQSVLLNINAFDQFGVELGKVLAEDVLSSMQGGDAQAIPASLDATTRALIARAQRA